MALDVYREIPSVLISTALGLRPRAVLISTSGIFPVYRLKPCVNLYLRSLNGKGGQTYNMSIPAICSSSGHRVRRTLQYRELPSLWTCFYMRARGASALLNARLNDSEF